MVYGSYTPDSCDEQISLSRKTSWTFKQSIYSRKNSGGPGYIKGNKVLTGVQVDNGNQTYVNMSTQPFKLRGADNQGNCLMSPSLPIEEMYFDDPSLLFDDSTIYGCRISLSRFDLENFCKQK